MKRKTIADYTDQVHAKFDKLERSEITAILVHGFRAYQFLNKWGADTIIADRCNNKFLMYTGQLHNNYLNYAKYYAHKYAVKLRILFSRSGKEWDGFHYFGLSEENNAALESQKDDIVIMLDNIMMYKLKEELELQNYPHHYKVRLGESRGYRFLMDTCEFNNTDYEKIK